MIGDIHRFRVEAHKIIKGISKLQATQSVEGDPKGAREFALAITKLQEARHWLGEALGAVGAELPAGYPKDEAE